MYIIIIISFFILHIFVVSFKQSDFCPSIKQKHEECLRVDTETAERCSHCDWQAEQL